MSHNEQKELSEKEIEKKYPDVYSSLVPLLREKTDSLEAYIETVECDVELKDTKTIAHCHFIASDGNQRTRVKDLARFISDRIVNFAIPRSEIKRALNEAAKLDNTSPILRLNSKARKLFTELPKSGEGGEVLLSILAESLLQLPQMFTKMVLKTSTSMHIHGCDGIHVGINEQNNNLAIYWGESKLHSNPTNATYECFESLAPFLLGDGGDDAVQERDLQLMRDGIDFNNKDLEEFMKMYLDPDDPKHKKLEYRGLCLIGFDTDAYPTKPNSKEVIDVKKDIEKAFNARKKHIIKRVSEENIESFCIQVFCLPFPSVEKFREEFQKVL